VNLITNGLLALRLSPRAGDMELVVNQLYLVVKEMAAVQLPSIKIRWLVYQIVMALLGKRGKDYQRLEVLQ